MININVQDIILIITTTASSVIAVIKTIQCTKNNKKHKAEIKLLKSDNIVDKK